ncbi:peptidoglycan-binding protein [Cronobacter turicensis]|uniref:peptidoglycan-binding protein n=1 Tax=Cronobacter turicensis TaxID=413502 RepID=UPI0011AE03C6|nr:peptidoglycan-binding protein [Cronobacter turicensis]EKY3118253.1 peptidoglycan-binding protein [Cronobacter turicensis]ELU8453970.1 peptidoglycan-binding protein [Cronobacter turicensis]ELY4111361.1 peptidoglycan-binding protein [Cronobacter turicensis]ELY4217727.1 peptidoglycan-binding protein [Cronobacter turicensis]EMA1791402.1 peptidoglycan-binding protein [Cronobacter turicensis]
MHKEVASTKVRRYHAEPKVFRLLAPVGLCGTNNSEDVRSLKKVIDKAGYAFFTGRGIGADSICNHETIEAIRWYQRLLNLSPSGLVQPTDTWFMKALNNVASWGPLPVEKGGILIVNEGQLTFDAEGIDYIRAVVPFRARTTYPYFSRVLHTPGTMSSGVTLGRGYDMGSRSSGEIFATLRQAGIEEYKAVLCSKAAFRKGDAAVDFVRIYGPFVGEISHIQQVQLFKISYQKKAGEARRLYERLSSDIPDAPDWISLDKKIKDVLVDIFFQGAHNVTTLFKAAVGGREKLARHISQDAIYMSFEPTRKRLAYLM